MEFIDNNKTLLRDIDYMGIYKALGGIPTKDVYFDEHLSFLYPSDDEEHDERDTTPTFMVGTRTSLRFVTYYYETGKLYYHSFRGKNSDSETYYYSDGSII